MEAVETSDNIEANKHTMEANMADDGGVDLG